jgi:hemerythrin
MRRDLRNPQLLSFFSDNPIVECRCPPLGGCMALISWSDQYSVGVKAIDAQHATLFTAVNELHAAMLQGNAQNATGPLLKKLLNYTRDHFTAEEKMLADSKYPELMEHRNHHRDLIKQVEDFMVRYERGDSTINIQLLRFLSNWLTRHIRQEDKQYSEWVNGHGVH